MKQSIEYLVGYRENDEFWAVFESDNEQEAYEYFEDSVKEDEDQDLARTWELYEKTINFNRLALQ